MTNGNHHPPGDGDGDGEAHRHSRRSETCPSWCTGEHREVVHPEDHVHRDRGAVFAAVLADVDATTLRHLPRPSEIVVQLVQGPADADAWVVIAESEDADRAMILTRESATRLRHCLPGED
ncbi:MULTISPECIES: DUF6907 domain-containing protein [unclassified Nocardioides]|uniref:DUF6907 domain-containing protein n=1 Tax=unclassified Nocardioides TaxID=2615069 RepID=UPI000A26A28A|nr:MULTISPECIES: hypothetical protein [unclassified Nocardioides]